MKRYVLYHSHLWESLVETDWITVSVDEDGIAEMFKEMD